MQILFIFKDFFFRFFPHTPVFYTEVSLYTLVAHTHNNFLHCLHTRNPFIDIFLYQFPILLGIPFRIDYSSDCSNFSVQFGVVKVQCGRGVVKLVVSIGFWVLMH